MSLTFQKEKKKLSLLIIEKKKLNLYNIFVVG